MSELVQLQQKQAQSRAGAPKRPAKQTKTLTQAEHDQAEYLRLKKARLQAAKAKREQAEQEQAERDARAKTTKKSHVC